MYVTFTYLNVRLFGFEYGKELYANDNDFADMLTAYGNVAFGNFIELMDTYLKIITCICLNILYANCL